MRNQIKMIQVTQHYKCLTPDSPVRLDLHEDIDYLFKLVKGENGTTSFVPLDSKKGGPVRYVKDREAICLTSQQVKHI